MDNVQNQPAIKNIKAWYLLESLWKEVAVVQQRKVYSIVNGAWVNNIPASEAAAECTANGVPVTPDWVSAIFTMKDIMFKQEYGIWPSELDAFEEGDAPLDRVREMLSGVSTAPTVIL